MAVQKALVSETAKAPWRVVENVDIASVGPTDVLVKVSFAGLNPSDWLSQSYAPPFLVYPFTGGLEGSGIVVDVGVDVKHVKKGDRVFFPGGFEGARPTFKEYCVCPGAFTLEQGATIPVGIATVVSGIWGTAPRGVGLTALWEEGGRTKYAGQPALVIGGASCVGQYAIQMARLNGFSTIITTASLKHESWLKSLGATHVLDRNLPSEELAIVVKKITNGALVPYAYDAISTKETLHLAYDLVADDGALVIVEPFSKELDEKIKLNDRKRIGRPYATLTVPESIELGLELWKHLGSWLKEGLIIPNRVDLVADSLQEIPAALEKMKNGAVSGTKWVARVL
ncbi:GroES-like protein [Epithele typhae]|uniref:GroES-like protein n=1 Tax=Epithele typhae TaxID=378194 RepID=UPI002007D3B9|nr:GroES-like protein [Epithele typhae]KAH9921203.1 GroES-like protein [Epithele typhae]